MASTMRSLAQRLTPPVTKEEVEVRHEEMLEPMSVSPAEVQVLEPEPPSIPEEAIEKITDVPPDMEVTHDVPIVENKPEKKSKPKSAAKKTAKAADQKKVNPPSPETET